MKVEDVDAERVYEWYLEGKALIVDVRESFEVAQERIPGAIHLPLAEICLSAISSLDLNGKELVMQCRSGMRSLTAGKKLIEEGLQVKVWNLHGGILAWKQLEYPTEIH